MRPKKLNKPCSLRPRREKEVILTGSLSMICIDSKSSICRCNCSSWVLLQQQKKVGGAERGRADASRRLDNGDKDLQGRTWAPPQGPCSSHQQGVFVEPGADYLRRSCRLPEAILLSCAAGPSGSTFFTWRNSSGRSPPMMVNPKP